jgi:hypothetical protein
MINFHAIHWQGFVSGAFAYGVAAYAARTIPIPDNRWARWIVGVLQFALSNAEKGAAAIPPPKP